MKLLFLAKGEREPQLTLSNELVNGFDLSIFPVNAKFIGNDDTLAAGIYNVERRNNELFVTLGQCGLPYECLANGGHDWIDTGEWIDAADYDPDRCYIQATSAPENTIYVKREEGWTVMSEAEEELA